MTVKCKQKGLAVTKGDKSERMKHRNDTTDKNERKRRQEVGKRISFHLSLFSSVLGQRIHC